LWFADESGDNQKATELPQLTIFEQDHPHHVDPNPPDHHGGGLGGRGGGGEEDKVIQVVDTLVDQEEEVRVKRGAVDHEEGSGAGLLGSSFPDYGIDDEDQVKLQNKCLFGRTTTACQIVAKYFDFQGNEYGSTNIVSSRVVPVASSPIFSLPPTTRSPR